MGFVFSESNIRENQIVFIYEESSFSGVRKIAGKVREDIEKVFSAKPMGVEYSNFADTAAFYSYPVFFGTVGHSAILDELAGDHVISLFDIAGEREVYSFNVVDGLEFGGFRFESAIIIAGSDKRGTIYGLFRLSEMLGVSPFTGWLGIRPEKRSRTELAPEDSFVSKSPSVKYRGLFINDEWPAFGNFCEHNFGGFNAKMYSHVFELILRLKGNYLWPAMWSAVFYEDGPGSASADLADELGIVMGTSHHEPCLRQGEEYSHVRGPGSEYGDDWNFVTNREGIIKFWADSLSQRCKYENVITVGMRGEADTPIMGKDSGLEENIALLRDVIEVQNALIKEKTGKNLEDVPRLFALYKEVEPFYYGNDKVRGLKGDPSLDGVTILLCDDNYGNLRTVPAPDDVHPGGYGMYYHFDYHGLPVSYEWFNTSYLPKVWEQLTMAYDCGIRDLWIANAGDIFTNEYPLAFFFDLAYDFDRWGTEEKNSAERYTSKFIEKNLPQLDAKDRETAAELLLGYTRITQMRRTEAMNDEVYAPFAFGESADLLAVIDDLMKVSDRLYKKMEDDAAFAFYELIHLPLTAVLNIQKMWLLTGENHAYAKMGSTAANALADDIRSCIKKDRKLVDRLHSVHKGKWYGMGLSEHIGFRRWCCEECVYPIVHTLEPSRTPRLIVTVASTGEHTEGGFWSGKELTLPDALDPGICGGFIELSTASSEKAAYSISSEDDFIDVKAPGKSVKPGMPVRIFIFADRMKLMDREYAEGTVTVSFADASIVVRVPVNNPKTDDAGENTFFYPGRNGYMEHISICAAHFAAKNDTDAGSFEVIGRYGPGDAIKAYPQNVSFETGNAPAVTYRFVLNKAGKYNVRFYTSPANPCRADGKVTFGVSAGAGEVKYVNTVPDGFEIRDGNRQWEQGVLDNMRRTDVLMELAGGMNELHVSAASPGFVLEKIVISPEGMDVPYSYLGPPESFHA